MEGRKKGRRERKTLRGKGPKISYLQKDSSLW
jgi:hypothetical protein